MQRFRLDNWAIISLLAITVLLESTAIAGQFSLTPRLSLSGEFTDNVFLQSKDKQDDFITSISPGLTASFQERTYGFDWVLDPEYVAYAQTTENNTWRYSGSFNGFMDITKNDTVTLSNRSMMTEEPFSYGDIAQIRNESPGVPVDPSIRLARNSYLQNNANARFTHQFGQKDSAFLNYNYSLLRNEDSTIPDNDVHAPSGGFAFWFSPRWGVDGNLSYEVAHYEIGDDLKRFQGYASLRRSLTKNLDGYIRYSHSDVQYVGATEDDRTYNPSVGVDYQHTNDISLLLDVGYFLNDFDLRSDQSGLTLDGLLRKRFQRGSIDATARGGYDYALSQAENNGFQLYAEGGVSGSYLFTRQFSGSLFASYRYSEYPDQLPSRIDKTTAAGCGMTSQLFKWMSASLNYSYRFVDSDTGAEYSENRLELRFSVFPVTPYRWN